MGKPEKRKITTFSALLGDGGDEIIEVPLHELVEFKNHPFKVLDDDSMLELIESIKENGILSPGIARPRQDGKYELISGHRRKRAASVAGLMVMPIIVRDLDDDAATIVMVDENLQRPVILPSEKAKSYRMKYDAMKHQGDKCKGLSLDELGEAEGASAKTIQRYIWLSRLEDELLDLIDTKVLGIVQGVDISFIGIEEQRMILGYLKENPVSVSTVQSGKLKEFGKTGELTEAMIRLILSEEKVKERKFTIKGDRLREFFDDDIPMEKIEEIIIGLLEDMKMKGGGTA